MDEDFASLLRRLMTGQITNREYCLMADDLLMTYTAVETFHLPESYVKAWRLRYGSGFNREESSEEQ